MKILVLGLLLFALASCSEQSEKPLIDDDVTSIKQTLPENGLLMNTIQNGPESFGYQIIQNGKVIINQVNIPAIQGNMGFSSRAKAQKTGDFVIQKIKKGFFPPSITPEEMDSLGVL